MDPVHEVVHFQNAKSRFPEQGTQRLNPEIIEISREVEGGPSFPKDLLLELLFVRNLNHQEPIVLQNPMDLSAHLKGIRCMFQDVVKGNDVDGAIGELG